MAREVLQDAIDSYETDQRKQFEGQLAHKADENAQIQTEMGRVKPRYTERLPQNPDGMARQKAMFGNWLTLKQQESESMREAMELRLNPPVVEKPSTPLEEVGLAGAGEAGVSGGMLTVKSKTNSSGPIAKPSFLEAETLGGASFGFGGFFFSIFGRRGGFERLQKAQGDVGNVIDGGKKGGFVGFGRLGEAGDFADKLKGSRADFLFGDRRFEIKKRFDISAHERNSRRRS